MTTPVVTVRPEQTSDELMLLMIDRGIRHVPVVSSGGELIGVATDVDLLANETHTPIMLRRAIAEASDAAGLRATVPQLRATLIAMHAAGLAAIRISGVLSVVVDALVRRLIELAVAEQGPPPADLAWLSLGSFGRREAMPSSDADSGMAWADEVDGDAAAYAHRVARSVVDELSGFGWDPDRHGVDATGAMAASSIGDWRRSIGKWLDRDVSEPELIAISIVLDARVIYGDEERFDLPALLREARPRPDLLRLLLRLALASKPPTGFMRDIVVEHSGEHAGHFDIKHGGLLPIVNIARYAGLAAGATMTSTVERLRARGRGREAGPERRGDARRGVRAVRRAAARPSDLPARGRRAARRPDRPEDAQHPHAPLPARRLQGRRLGAEVADDEARVEHLSARGRGVDAAARRCRRRERPGRRRGSACSTSRPPDSTAPTTRSSPSRPCRSTAAAPGSRVCAAASSARAGCRGPSRSASTACAGRTWSAPRR